MPSNATETIDARILRLIGLEDTFDLDYDTYLTLLKEAAVKGRMPKTTIPIEEVELLTDELKRVKSKKDKGRFKVKKKKITATTLKTGGGGTLTGKKTSIPVSRLLPAAQEGGFNVGETFAKIAESVTSIANTLTEKKKLLDKESAFDRKADENERRKLQKENLKKRFAKMAAVAQKIIQPVKSLLDKILNYFAMIFFGRIAIKLLNWFTDSKNKSKVAAVGRFLGDHGPKLFGLWIAFGTGFGKAIRVLLRVVGKGIAKLIAATGKLAVAAGLKKFGGLSKFGGRRGQLLGTALEIGGTLWAMNAIDNAFKGDEGEDTQGLANGGVAQKLPGFAGGGLFSGGFGNIFKRFNSKSSSDIVPGSGTGDTVSAMLTPGEAVLQVGARERQIEATGIDPLSFNVGPNANRPQMVDGTMFAATGGLVGRESGSFRVPPWKDVGASVLSGLSGALNTLNVEGSKLHGLATRGKYGLSGGSSGFKMDGSGILSQLTGAAGSVNEWVGSKAEGLKDLRYPGENWAIERERRLGLMEPGADSLTKETRAKLKAHDNYIRGLSGIRKSIENKGFIPDPFMLLKTEGAEKLVQNLSGGKIKNLGAKITGLQYAAKGLLGPLGRAFRIDDMGSLGRYLRPAMEEAQKQGHSSVGRKALGGEMYDKLVGDKLANLALGQTQFRVGKDGRAVTDDTYDSNRTAEFYLKKSREALKSGDMGTALFNGLSGLLRVNQNTGWGNLRPGGLGVDLGEGYQPTDASGKLLPQAKISQQQKPKTAPPPPSIDQRMYDKYGVDLGTGDYGGTWAEATAVPSPATPSNPAMSVIDAVIVNPFNSLKGAILGLGG